MRLRFLQPAVEELVTAINYYDQIQPELGNRFRSEVKRALERIRTWPSAWMSLGASIRRCRVKGFPYGIIYAVEQNFLVVVSIMNLYQHPNSWRRNLNPPA